MMIRQDTQVHSIIMDDPAMSLVLEHFGIDYYCDGARKSLAEACEDKVLSVEQVLDRLNEQKSARASASELSKLPFDPESTPVSEIVGHIVSRYHAKARRDIPRIRKLAELVRRRHGVSHPELIEVERVFRVLSEDLEHHMRKEEQALFPGFASSKDRPQDGTKSWWPIHNIARSINVIEAEHQDCEDMLLTLRRLTQNYVPLPDACTTDRPLYQGLEQFESDTRGHVSLEDNVLFPRVLQEQRSVIQS